VLARAPQDRAAALYARPVLAVRHYTAGGCAHDIDPASISEHYRDEGLVWVDVLDGTEDELNLLAHEFSLHPMAMEDARLHGQRPKLQKYRSHAFVVAYSPDLVEVDIFVGPTWLITVRARNADGQTWPPEDARARFERVTDDEPNVGVLLHTILEELVTAYFDAADRAEDKLEEIEEMIFAEQLKDESTVQRHLFDVRRGLLQRRRTITPMREVVAAIERGEVPWIEGETLLLYDDLYDHVLRATELVDTARELMGNAVDAHLAIISNRMNQVTKRFAAWGTILFGAALVASIYGMNFTHMPELDWRLGYPMALGMMAVLTIVLYRVFKDREWL
jgi:magnesium transporter